MFVGNQDKLIQRSGFRRKQTLYDEGETQWCENHPLGFWGKMKNGEWFSQCAIGFKLKEECKSGGGDKE